MSNPNFRTEVVLDHDGIGLKLGDWVGLWDYEHSLMPTRGVIFNLFYGDQMNMWICEIIRDLDGHNTAWRSDEVVFLGHLTTEEMLTHRDINIRTIPDRHTLLKD